MPHANNQSRESILRFVTVSSPMSCPWWVHIVRYFLVCTLRTRHGNRFPIRYVSKDQSNDFNTTKYIDHVSDVNMNTSYIHNFITYLLSRNMSSCSAISDQLPLLYCTKEGRTCVRIVCTVSVWCLPSSLRRRWYEYIRFGCVSSQAHNRLTGRSCCIHSNDGVHDS